MRMHVVSDVCFSRWNNEILGHTSKGSFMALMADVLWFVPIQESITKHMMSRVLLRIR